MTDEEQVFEIVGDLELGPAPLAPRRVIQVDYVRDLGEADIEALRANRGIRPRELVRIHSSHHALARCLAAGMKQSQASLITGYNPARISQLENDETFKALVADYRLENKTITADLAERMANLSLDAIELLQERLHDSPQDFSVPVLLDVVRAFADRTGHGPGQEINHRLNVDFVDRPPRENYEQWQERRMKEIAPDQNPALPGPEPDKSRLN